MYHLLCLQCLFPSSNSYVISKNVQMTGQVSKQASKTGKLSAGTLLILREFRRKLTWLESNCGFVSLIFLCSLQLYIYNMIFYNHMTIFITLYKLLSFQLLYEQLPKGPFLRFITTTTTTTFLFAHFIRVMTCEKIFFTRKYEGMTWWCVIWYDITLWDLKRCFFTCVLTILAILNFFFQLHKSAGR